MTASESGQRAAVQAAAVEEGASVPTTNEMLHDRLMDLARLPERGLAVDLGCGAGPARGRGESHGPRGPACPAEAMVARPQRTGSLLAWIARQRLTPARRTAPRRP
jgi:hypothetical protein